MEEEIEAEKGGTSLKDVYVFLHVAGASQKSSKVNVSISAY